MSKYWAVHNEEDEVAFEMPKPEPRYEPERAKMEVKDNNAISQQWSGSKSRRIPTTMKSTDKVKLGRFVITARKGKSRH